jgi:hypothetical protein
MADAESGSPLEAAAGAAGPHATDAFALLADETRLAVLLALWELHDPEGNDDAVSFSELYDRVDYDNPGNFGYHLKELEGQFIRKRPDDEGYELLNTGLEIVRSVIAGAGVQDTTLEPTEIDRTCHLCDGTTAVNYEDGVLYQVCTECAGLVTRDDLPDGYLNSITFDPAGLTGRSPEKLLAAAEIAAYQHMRSMFQGFCSACSGPVHASLETCGDHESDGVCANCGRAPAYTAHFRCRVCKDFHGTTPEVLSVFHPAVVAFLYDHGTPPRWHVEKFDGLTYVGGPDPEFEATLVSQDPDRVEVTISIGDDELRLTFDETVSVCNVDW